MRVQSFMLMAGQIEGLLRDGQVETAKNLAAQLPVEMQQVFNLAAFERGLKLAAAKVEGRSRNRIEEQAKAAFARLFSKEAVS